MVDIEMIPFEINLTRQEYTDLMACAEERGVTPAQILIGAMLDDLAR